MSWKQTRVNVDEIVAKHLAAIGGVEANMKQTSRKLEGTLTIAGGTPGKITVTQKAPNLKHVRVEHGVQVDDALFAKPTD